MNRSIESFLAFISSALNIHIEKASSESDILEIISKFRPYNSGHKLIRMGPDGDGGYLVPDDLANIEACFSPGVGEFYQFELDCLNRGMKVFLADKSVENPSVEGLSFIPKFLGVKNDENHVTLENWVAMQSSIEESSDLLLQMDIEGGEYQTMLGVPTALLNRFRIIVLEVHWLNKIWSTSFGQIVNALLDKLNENHTCIHIHPNNYLNPIKRSGIIIPKALEVTFIRNDRLLKREKVESLQHVLDQDNSNRKTMELSEHWNA
ncbi:MAG: FkbM family methyltransferase [Bacteroidota bacterium]